MRLIHLRDIRRILVALGALLLISGHVAFAQKQRNAVIWKDPGKIASRDLLWGSGSPDRAPKGPFTFVEKDTSGTQPKIRVKDAAGRLWDVKFGDEVHAEIAASRIVGALGYFAEELYYVPEGTITGMSETGSLKEFVGADGRFSKARFDLRSEEMKKAEKKWSFQQNPFLNSRELSGLAILMTMINNWDLQGSRNTRVIDAGNEDRYMVSDLGASFGKMGGVLVPRSKWNLEDFKKEEFIEKVEDGQIDLDFEGQGGINKVPIEHARWFYGLISQLTDEQLRAAFRAAGATDAEIDGFSAKVREKITELQKAVGS